MRLGQESLRRLGARAVVVGGLAVAIAVGFTWGLPGPDTWAVDSISPRSCGLGAIVETYWPGHWHHYPPLHMAILTIFSLPWMAMAVHHVGTGLDALTTELLKPFYMTGIEICSRVVTGVMALAVVANTMRLWERIGGRRAGTAAGVVVATNATFVYYAHTGNLETPYLFWLTWGLVELDRVASGEPRERQALLLAIASVLTKDQAAAAWLLPLPVYLVVLPRVAGGKPPFRRSLVIAAVLAVSVYAVVSGAVTNPTGFAQRVRVDVLHAGESWASYPRSVAGRLALARDTILGTTRFTSWPVAFAAAIGLGLVVAQRRGLERARGLLPFLAALSFTIFFNLGARRTDNRFLLPQSLLFFPYAALAFDAAVVRWTRWRALVYAGATVALLPALIGVASLDATLLADPRYEVERFLAALPAGTHVEVYGSVPFLPRIPANLVAVPFPGFRRSTHASQSPASATSSTLPWTPAAAASQGDRPRDGVQQGLGDRAARTSAVRSDAVHRRGQHPPVPRALRRLARLHADAASDLLAPAPARVPEHPRRDRRRALGYTSALAGAKVAELAVRRQCGEGVRSMRRSVPSSMLCHGSSVIRSDATNTASAAGDQGVSTTVPSRLLRLSTYDVLRVALEQEHRSAEPMGVRRRAVGQQEVEGAEAGTLPRRPRGRAEARSVSAREVGALPTPGLVEAVRIQAKRSSLSVSPANLRAALRGERPARSQASRSRCRCARRSSDRARTGAC